VTALRCSKRVRGADAIAHTTAQVAVTTSLEHPVTDFEVNALGTLNVLEAARRKTRVWFFLLYGKRVNSIPAVEKQTRYESILTLKKESPRILVWTSRVTRPTVARSFSKISMLRITTTLMV